MRNKLFFTALMFISCNFLYAQSLEDWTWDTYKIKFKAPDNMRIEENDANSFKATNGNIALDIYPRKGENLSYAGMKKAIINWADQTGLNYNSYNSNGNSQPIYLDDINRYWGCAIDGKKKGYPTTILLLVDPDYPDISFYIWISYSSDYYRDAVTILKSFKPM